MKNLSKTAKIAIVIAVLDVILTVVAIFVLPEQAVVQIATSGSTPNTLAKPFAILVPFAITGASLALYIKPDYQNNKKAIVSAVFGLILFVLIIAANV